MLLSKPVFDPTAVTVKDIVQMAENTGLLDLQNEFNFTRLGNYIQYNCFHKDTKNFMWTIGFEDTENGGYMACRFFACINENGIMCGDWGGCPVENFETIEQLDEFFENMRKPA